MPKARVHGGTTDIRNKDPKKPILGPDEIGTKIVNLVNICRDYGVNDVYVSEIIFRPDKEKEVDDVNNFLRARSFINDFYLINNRNLYKRHLRKDQLHLNFYGTNLLANNFINTLNGKLAK